MANTKILDFTLITPDKLDEMLCNDVTDNSDKRVTMQGILDAMTGDITSASGVTSIAAKAARRKGLAAS